MNILIASNEKYLKHELVMLSSLRECMPNEVINVYLLHGTLKKSSIEKFSNYLKNRLNMEFYSIEVNATFLDSVKIGMHLSIETMYRLIASERLPHSVDRILWLDGDIIIKGSLSDLYGMNFEDYYICACIGRGDIKQHNNRLGLPKEHKYFNAGVLLLNIRKMREEKITDRFRNIILEYKERLTWMDQDVLNIAFCHGEVMYLPSEVYNCQIGRDFRLNQAQYKLFIENCFVMHFAARAKPWKNTYINGLERFYWKYALRNHRYIEYLLFRLISPAKSVYQRFKAEHSE